MAGPTRRQRESMRDRTRHCGQWILADTADDRPLLLSIGEHLYPGTSLRTGLDFVARRAVLPHMVTAATTGNPITDVVHIDGRRWTVRAAPVLGVFSGRPVAVLGCYDKLDQDLPPPPLVGSWEWVQTPPGAGQIPRTYWSAEQYRVFGIAPREPAWWEGPQWLDELIAVADRPGLRALWATHLADTSAVLRFHTHTATPPTGERYALRSAGRRHEENGQVYLRGVSARLQDQNVEPQPTHLEAVLGLSRDPLCMIDPTDEVIYLTSDSCSTLGLKLPNTRHLPEMCHPEDMPVLRAALTRAGANIGRLQGPITVRFAAVAGGWRQLEVCSRAVHVTPQSIHVWCRIREHADD